MKRIGLEQQLPQLISSQYPALLRILSKLVGGIYKVELDVLEADSFTENRLHAWPDSIDRPR